MREGLLVDAYNLFHTARASSHARSFPDLKRLAYFLEHYVSGRDMRAVFVVDGTRFSDEIRGTPALTVLFSGGGEPADAVMESWMARLAPAEKLSWVLVSNDVELGRMASGMGLRVRSCASLVQDLAAFARCGSTHSLDPLRRPSGPAKPFNDPFSRLAAAAVLMLPLLFAQSGAGAAEFGGFLQPDSAACDPVSGEIYVSNAAPVTAGAEGSGAAGETGGFISKISGNGLVLIQKFVQGGVEGGGRELRNPKGMAVIADRLYVADGDLIRSYSTATGEAGETVEVRGEPRPALGPLTVDRGGNLYAADTATSRIYRIDTRRSRRVTLFSSAETLGEVVGLAADPGTGHLLAVTRRSGEVIELDRRSRARVIKRGLGALDGIVIDGSGAVHVASAERGEIYRVLDRGRGAVSLTASGLRAPSGIGYDAVRHALVVPLKFDGRLMTVPLEKRARGLIPKNSGKRAR